LNNRKPTLNSVVDEAAHMALQNTNNGIQYARAADLDQISDSLIGISLFTYILAVQLPFLKGKHGKTGRNTLQP